MKKPTLDTTYENSIFFSTPQIEGILQTLISEINNQSRIICLIGPHNSGKTYLAHKFLNDIGAVYVQYDAFLNSNFPSFFPRDVSEFVYDGKCLKNTGDAKRIIVLIDNAHNMTDDDLKFIDKLCTKTKSSNLLFQFIMVGSGELVAHLNTSEHHNLYSKIQRLINIPRLNKEQSLDYISFLLSSSGCSQNLFANPEALALKAEGLIGKLRMLTITLAYKALGEQKTTDCRLVLDNADRIDATENVEDSKTHTHFNGSSISFPFLLLFFVCFFGLIMYIFSSPS